LPEISSLTKATEEAQLPER